MDGGTLEDVDPAQHREPNPSKKRKCKEPDAKKAKKTPARKKEVKSKGQVVDGLYDYVFIGFIELDFDILKSELSSPNCKFAILTKAYDKRIHAYRIRGYFLVKNEIDVPELESRMVDCKISRFDHGEAKYTRYTNVKRYLDYMEKKADSVTYLGSRDNLFANKYYCGKRYPDHVCNCDQGLKIEFEKAYLHKMECDIDHHDEMTDKGFELTYVNQKPKYVKMY